MRNYCYPDIIKEINIPSSSTQNERYYLEVVFNESISERIVVILHNPSIANNQYSDSTINRVTNILTSDKLRADHNQLNSIGGIIFLNLFPKYETDSTELYDSKDEIISHKNIEILRETLRTNKNVILAWGNAAAGISKEFEAMKSIVALFIRENRNKVYRIGLLTKDNNPRHGRMWSYESKLEDYEFVKEYEKIFSVINVTA